MGRRARAKRLKQGRRLRRLAAVLLVGLAVVCTSVPAALLLSGLAGGSSGPKTAAIVDQLSEHAPNPAFVAAATEMLQEAGYVVEYYPSQEVTVDFYRELPSHRHDLIVLRSHSSLLRKVWRGEQLNEVVIFTSEPYNPTRYRDEAEAGLAKVRYHEGGDAYFGVRAHFVTSSMRGGFEGATIILMGCDGLQSQTTGQAFLDKGASAFASWTDSVSGSHSDAATERLLQLMLIEGLPTVDAVVRTDAELGPDPSSGAELRVLTP